MEIFPIDVAQARFPELVKRAQNGERIRIDAGNGVVAELVALPEDQSCAAGESRA